jgi:hypothetical protein
VTGAKEQGEGRCWAGGGGEMGQLGPLRARGKEKEKGLPAWVGCGPKVKGERDRKRKRFFPFSFEISFQIHFFSNNQTLIKQKSMHSNHDAQTLIISKLF